LMFVFGREEEWSIKLCMELVLRPCTVYVVLFVNLCWCVSDCIRTANGAQFLCDIAQTVCYARSKTDYSVGGINCGRSVVAKRNICTTRSVL